MTKKELLELFQINTDSLEFKKTNKRNDIYTALCERDGISTCIAKQDKQDYYQILWITDGKKLLSIDIMNKYLKVIEHLFNNYKNKIIVLETRLFGGCVITIDALGKPNCRIAVFDDKYQTIEFGKQTKIQKTFEALCEELDYYFS